jgi:plasmid stabilization system protein ParE
MSQTEVFVRHDAELDALGYFEYLHKRDAETASRFLAAIDRTVEGLAIQPLKGRLRTFRGKKLKNVRSWRVDDFENPLIFYRLTGKRLEVLRVKHGAMSFPRALRRTP